MKNIPRKHVLCLLLATFFLTGCPLTLKPDTPPTTVKQELRLPKMVTPTRYVLDLDLTPASPSYSGEVRIDVRLDTAQTDIHLHAKGLTLDHVQYRHGTKLQTVAVHRLESGRVQLRGQTPFPSGKGVLEIRFSGQVTTTPDGLYRVRDGEDDYIFSQFEPISARTAFPCFDEPRFKAPFKISVRAPKGNVVVSNAPEVKRIETATHTHFEFKETRPLPTYLVAFGIGPLEIVTSPETLENQVPFRVVVPRGKAGLTAFALRETLPIHRALRAYLDSDYPYQKLDFMAVPNFRAGAMENAGLVTFREALLLVDESKVTGGRLRSIRNVIAHELAHMWFGNSLTLAWWDDIWLNEAFATWMADRVNVQLGNAEASHRAITRSKQRVMRLDAKANVRAIRQPISTEGDIENAFDGISYRKGASVLWMLERWLGEAELQKALQAYVRTHAHQAVTTADLMVILDRETKKPVSHMAEAFLNEPGVPRLDFDLKCSADKPPVLRVLQTVSRKRSGPMLPWRVPVCVRYGVKTSTSTTCFELQDMKADVELSAPSCPTWFYGNAQESGYYTWSMSMPWLERLLDNLSVLTAVEKSALPARLRRRAESGGLSLGLYVPALVKLMSNDLDSVKSEALNNLVALAPVVGTTSKKRDAFYQWLGAHLQPMWVGLQTKSVDPSDVEAVRFRSRVRQLLAFETKDEAVLTAGLKRLRALLKIPSAEWTSEDRQLLIIGGLSASDSDWDALKSRLDTERDAPNRGAIIRAMASHPNTAKRTKTRGLFTDGVIEAQNFWLVARGLGWRDRDERWDWVKTSMKDLKDRLTEGGFSGLPWIGAGYCSPAKSADLDRLFGPYLSSHSAMKRSLALSKEYISECVALRKLWKEGVDGVLDPPMNTP